MRKKYCTRCKKESDTKKFKQCLKCRIEHRKIGNRYYEKNKEKCAKVGKLYDQNNREKRREYDRKYRKKNKKRLLIRWREYGKKYRIKNRNKVRELDKNLKRLPWYKTYHSVLCRCRSVTHRNYKRYGGKGVKLKMVPNDFKYLWFRDKAYLMKKPSIHRKNDTNPKKWHYKLENCCYIELSENISLSNKKRKYKRRIL